MATPLEWTADKDHEWRTALKRASLIAELDIDDEDLEQATDYLGRFLQNKSPGAMRRKFPAFYLVAVAAVGMQEWALGTFYPLVARKLGVNHDDAEQLTREFHEAL